MHAASHNLQRGIRDTLDFKHKMFQGKHVKLSGELPSFLKKLPSLREKLPSFAKSMLVRARTYIDFVRAPLAPAPQPSGIPTS